ncbi:protein draper-like isoform X3 [Haliotis rubra]|uniref:protein draper-like isoform X3 n=1 Tax=Haliotis rubra TaxID=36100 RepID=UPI001EE4F787|nr:protein draper-like isoform X3 [Haliotis rubra]XP_046558979.1 protein draper-like isoform X3 [Haliotis rubra]
MGCLPGRIGSDCSQECTNGRYGQNCIDSCSDRKCAGNSPCDHIRGACVSGCAPGWMGEDCRGVCDSQHYGANCDKACASRHCRGSSSCNSARDCDIGCETGWTLNNCTDDHTRHRNHPQPMHRTLEMTNHRTVMMLALKLGYMTVSMLNLHMTPRSQERHIAPLSLATQIQKPMPQHHVICPNLPEHKCMKTLTTHLVKWMVHTVSKGNIIDFM